jgi:two-component system alkaline phosphatase synthesis response regulator PhoP
VPNHVTPAIDILVADDEPHIARALSFIFTKEGYRVDIAVDGETALEILASRTPKIIFLDLVMPKKNGYEVCRAVKTDQRLRNAYVIILTCKGQELDRKRGLEAGADEFMTKPFSPKEVVARVKVLLET